MIRERTWRGKMIPYWDWFGEQIVLSTQIELLSTEE